MKLDKKKELAAKTLDVGKNRIAFSNEHLSEIKEAITKQDIIDLHKSGAIKIKPVKGRKKVEKRKTKRKLGKIKIKPGRRKKDYVLMTRKLRKYLKGMKVQNKLETEKYKDMRKKIRARYFKSLSQLKEVLK